MFSHKSLAVSCSGGHQWYSKGCTSVFYFSYHVQSNFLYSIYSNDSQHFKLTSFSLSVTTVMKCLHIPFLDPAVDEIHIQWRTQNNHTKLKF